MFKIFVDGLEGTTGLKINERLSDRNDIEILKINPDKRKDINERKKFLNEADLVFLCLPDEASREAVSLIDNKNTKVIDASTAFRTNPDWTYGLPELNEGQRNKIKESKRVCVPGCHATGFVIALNPLIQEGVAAKDYPVVCYSLTGYSGGGKKLINVYENKDADIKKLNAPRHYALTFKHKHLPEMQNIIGLTCPPLFSPIVGNFYQGMAVSIPLHKRLLKKKVNTKDIFEIFLSYYFQEYFIRVIPLDTADSLEDGFLNPLTCNGTNFIDLFTFGNEDQIMIMARLDNLGKGASGAAIQNMNLMLGFDEKISL